LRQRLTAARQTLANRAEDSAIAEEWKLWVNRDMQQRLIDRAEALLAAGDPRQMLREIGQLDQEWKRFAAAPRDQAQALWDRFRRARDELRRRGAAYLADNLAKKEALCVAAEQLADSTDWNVTAAAIRRMQEEWKQIGPVRQQLSTVIRASVLPPTAFRTAETSKRADSTTEARLHRTLCRQLKRCPTQRLMTAAGSSACSSSTGCAGTVRDPRAQAGGSATDRCCATLRAQASSYERCRRAELEEAKPQQRRRLLPT
jgi:hypothetical protein